MIRLKNNWYTIYKFAHRGLHNSKFAENTLEAFENAINHGFGIELDVRLTKDNQVVVFHDDNTSRLCGENKKVIDLTLENLRSLKINNKHTIPTLQEVLDLVQDRVPIIIEMKNIKGVKNHSELIYNTIKNYTGRIAVKSFNPRLIAWFTKHAPHITRGILASKFNDTKLPFYQKFILKNLLYIKKVNPHFISYCYGDMPSKYLKHIDIPLLLWTIRNKDEEEKALKLANSIIFENYIPQTAFNK